MTGFTLPSQSVLGPAEPCLTGRMAIHDVRARFPAKEREAFEIDRILIEEPRSDGQGTRFAIDLRAGYSEMNLQMGAGSPRLGRKVKTAEALVAMDAFLGGVEIERLDAFGAGLGNADVEALLETRWFAAVRALNLGANHLTKKATDALAKHPIAKQLEWLGLSYNKLGAALTKAKFPQLRSLEVVYSGIADAALAKLGTAPMPRLERLLLDGAALHSTPTKLVNANRMGDPVPVAKYSAAALSAFGKSPLARQLQVLGLGSLAIGEAEAKAIADAFEELRELDLKNAQMTAAAAAALASGGGLRALRELGLHGTFAPKYSHPSAPNAPAPETADAMRALASAPFAATLKTLDLGGVSLGPAGVAALFGGKLTALERVHLENCQVGDEGLAAIAGAETIAPILLLKSNEIGPRGVSALLESPLANQLTALDLSYNAIGDDGVKLLAASPTTPSLTKLALMGSHLTDISAEAIASSELGARLELLLLLDNRVSDAGAAALAQAALPQLTRLHLGKNCLTAQGVKALRQAYPDVALYLDEQDPSKLPPRVIGNDDMRFVEVQGLAKPQKQPAPAALRQRFPYPAWVERELTNPDFVNAMAKNEEGAYQIAVYHEPSQRLIAAEPAILSPLPVTAISEDGQWLAIKTFEDGAYAVRLRDGASTRLGDVLTHQKGGVAFCGGRIVVLDCDTEGEWEGRLDVYAPPESGQGDWVREHSIGGFFDARDDIVALANERLLAVTGSQGLFFCAVRGSELRFLGHLPLERFEVFGLGGRVFVKVQSRFTYELTNVDEVLDRAFAAGESPGSIALGKDAWNR